MKSAYHSPNALEASRNWRGGMGVHDHGQGDENGNVVSPSAMGMPDGYPTTSEVTVLLKDIGGRTKMLMKHAGVPVESGANTGWEQAFDKLADYIETTLKNKS
jgi:hypothetical protein